MKGSKKLNLPIFRDSTSDNAITYDDWHSEVDNYVREGHSSNLIRDSVLSTLRRTPEAHSQRPPWRMENGTLKSVMSALDQVYGGATTYTTCSSISLTASSKDTMKLLKDYYE